MAYTAPTFETTAVINSTTLFKDYDDQVQILIEDVGQYLEDESNAIYQDLGTIVTDGIINDTSAGSLTTYSSNKINTIADTKQPTLVSGTNIKTVNSTTLLGSGDVAVQPTLVSGTNIKTINGTSLLGSGNISITETTWVANDSRAMTALNSSGSAPIYACRAWVNFNGTGTVAIRASGNVSSITDNGVGDYTVNFTNSMPDANYSFNRTTSCSSATYSYFGSTINSTTTPFAFNTTSIRFTVEQRGSSSTPQSDSEIVCISIFR